MTPTRVERKREMDRLWEACRQCGAILSMVILAGCQTPAVSPDEVQLHTVSSETVAPVATVVGQGVPVAYQLAVVESLNKPEMLVRVGPQPTWSERHQWAEPLSDGLERLVRIRLGSVSGVSRIVGVGRESGTPPRVRVMVRVDRFEGEILPDDLCRAVVDAGWRIASLDDASAPVLASGVFVREDDTWDGKDYERLKLLLRDLAADLADAVAGSLEAAVKPFQAD